MEISIRAHNVKVTKAELTTLPAAEVMHFKVDVDGVELDDPLVCVRSREFTVFSIKAPKHYTNMLLSDEIRNTYPLAVLRALIDNSWFASYLLTEVVEKRNRALRIQEILGRITEETERFRDVLLRKYKQLTYIDEYETLEAARFKDELGRFATKRLHDIQDIPASTVVELIFDRVSQWASEDDSSSEKTLFDPNMSPIDYERFCAERFAALGWVTRLTKSSGDQGADLICEANHRRLVVQCKLYSGSVGNAAVQEAIAAREYEYADLAAVVSNGPFTTSAKELASAAHVLLLHHDEIALVLP